MQTAQIRLQLGIFTLSTSLPPSTSTYWRKLAWFAAAAAVPGKSAARWHPLSVVLTGNRFYVQINPRVSISMIVKSWAILGTLAVSFYVAFFAATNFLVRATASLCVCHVMLELAALNCALIGICMACRCRWPARSCWG
jgi:hypothetical protein